MLAIPGTEMELGFSGFFIDLISLTFADSFINPLHGFCSESKVFEGISFIGQIRPI